VEIIVAPKAGFCFGVKRAVEMAEKTVRTADGPVSTLGPLIHNPLVVGNLAVRGVKAVDTPAAAAGGTLIIRSHGAPPAVIAQAEGLGLTVVDATCPFVRKAQKLAHRLAAAGYQVIVVGDAAHPEIKGVVAAAGEALVVADQNDLIGRKLRARVGLICQTTSPPETLSRIAAAVAPICRELVVYNTICTATYERQQGALALARSVDAMAVVGGAESANTAHLAEVCRDVVPTFLVEKAEDLRPEWFAGMRRVGLTAGASTPSEQIEAVRLALKKMT